MPIMTHHKESGATLVETLVALFILAIGLLGVLAMQATSVKSNQRAQFASEVQIIAGDLADSIYAYDNVTIAGDDDDFDGIDSSDDVTKPDCISAACNQAQQINFIVADWQDALQTRLPSGKGTVDFDAARNLYTIVVMWDNEQTGAAGEDCSGNADVDLACYQLEVAL